MTIDELYRKANDCRQRAESLKGPEHHRELQRAQALEAEAGERKYYKTRMAGFKQMKNNKEAAHG
jgi:hypothetical protein